MISESGLLLGHPVDGVRRLELSSRSKAIASCQYITAAVKFMTPSVFLSTMCVRFCSTFVISLSLSLSLSVCLSPIFKIAQCIN